MSDSRTERQASLRTKRRLATRILMFYNLLDSNVRKQALLPLDDPRRASYARTIATIQANIEQLRADYPDSSESLDLALEWVKLEQEEHYTEFNGITL